MAENSDVQEQEVRELFRQGLEHFREGLFREALMHWEAVRRLKPDWPSIDMHINVAERQKIRSRLDLETLEKSFVQSHGDTVEIDSVAEAGKKFQRALMDGQEQEAEIELYLLLKDRPRDPRALQMAAEGFLKLKNPLKMREMAARMTEVQKIQPKAHLLLGRAHLACEDPEAALFCFRRAKELASKPSAAIEAHLGLAAIHLSDWGMARECFEKAIGLRPEDPRFERQLRLIESEEKALIQDVDELLRALESQPGYPDVLWQKGSLNRRAGRHDLALRYFEQALQKNPLFHKALYDRASILFELGRFEESAKTLSVLLDDEELRPDQASNILAFLRAGYFEEAAQELLKLMKVRPDYGSLHIHMGRELLIQGRTEEAFEELKKGVRLAPHYPDGHFHLGGLYEQKGELQQARVHYQEAWELNPFYYQAAFCYVDILVLEGETGAARIALRKVASCLSPQDPWRRQAEEKLSTLEGSKS